MNKQQLFKLSEHVGVRRVGGKAYALGKMLRAGFIIPDAFVISAEVFNAMAPALNDAVLSAFDKLGTEFVAVRSSAVNEDGKDAAWAGQLDTFLNCTRENLIQSVKDCWASASNARAQSYAQQKGIEATKVAVIVQAMVESEVSGIVFSAHPVSGDTTQMVVEAGLGLGEAVVSGQITPDTYILDKKREKLIEKHVALQNKKLARSYAGKTEWLDIGIEGTAQKLSDEQIIKLCKVTEKLEKFFRYPVDVEWALSNGKMYILQSRPITTLEQTRDTIIEK